MKNYNVLPGKILVRPDDGETKTESGVIIPDLGNELQKKGTVVSVGPDAPRITMVVKEGDRILYSQHAGEPIDIEDKEFDLQGKFLIMNQSQVLIFKTQKQ